MSLVDETAGISAETIMLGYRDGARVGIELGYTDGLKLGMLLGL